MWRTVEYAHPGSWLGSESIGSVFKNWKPVYKAQILILQCCPLASTVYIYINISKAKNFVWLPILKRFTGVLGINFGTKQTNLGGFQAAML